ncbi:hypothetical protein [Rhodococcus sp. H29-C3]|uniref:hypothetical protein n=1 Tax=Rhodococcus sp. H29-C3 TaxID=3046307 RepID=UPI0024B8B9ED|nr:hypothetical protein [Rhodococcus sp. H29-C3]MDJ0362231.1 hypothetical protein [Rhodococcus sp. H29-C3]
MAHTIHAMGRQKRIAFTDEQRLKAFVLRARRITSHSLWREQRDLMERARSGQMNVLITKDHRTNEDTYVLREEYPAEELMESLAARIRPLTLDGDDLHFAKVLNSVAALAPAAEFPPYIEPITIWHKMWENVATRDDKAQAYYIVTEQGTATDQDLMYAWFYGDVVHADDKEAESKGLGVTERYKAAAGIVARIVDHVHLTLLLVESLVDEGVLTIDPELFARDVIVTETVFEKPVKAYASDVETPLPTNDEELDPSVWQPMSEALSDHLTRPSGCDLW